jgi:hypothetical protein
MRELPPTAPPPERAPAGRDFALLDAHDAPPSAVTAGANPTTRTWIGLAAIALVATGISLSFERLATSHPAGGGPVLHDAPAPAGIDPTSLAASLASAAGALVELESLRRRPATPDAPQSPPSPRAAGAFPPEPGRATTPPAPEAFLSPTDCMNTYLPGVDIVDRSLDVVCEERDLWSIEWKIHPRIAYRDAEGGRRWAQLGPYTLAAIATLRAGCCKDPEPLLAVVPVLTCGILRDELRAFGPVPERTAFEAYESTMTCLAARNVRLPPRWAKASKDDSEAAFRRFVEIARGRAQ